MPLTGIVSSAVLYLVLGQFEAISWAREYKPKIQNIELFPENFREEPFDVARFAEKTKRSDESNKETLYPLAHSSKEPMFTLDDGNRFINDYTSNERENHPTVDRHQIYKRYLNEEYSNKISSPNMSTGDSSKFEDHSVGKKSAESSTNQANKDSYFDTDRTKNDLILNRNVINNANSEEMSDSFNSQGFYPLKDSSNVEDNLNSFDMFRNIISEPDADITYIQRDVIEPSEIKVISKREVEKVNETDDKDKREAQFENDSSHKAIKEEIDKVYKDITENVRLLTKLRDKESQFSKNPSKKRWIIVDNLCGNPENRRKRCNQELSVEIDTNRDASPDKLEHVERKIEEELLQVNVPLKCTH